MLKDRISEDIKTAMKAQDKDKLSTLRMVMSALKNAEIEKRAELEDEDVIKVLAREAKQRQEAAGEYEKAGREDLMVKERAEEAWIREYLPEQIGEDELEALIKKAVEDSGASGAKDMGKVMALLMPQIRGRADGKFVNEKVRELLGE